jgi:predicted metal-dependent enzyme (double-stranded beta helix superfamily)
MQTRFAPFPVAQFSDALAARTCELLDETGLLSESALETLVTRIAARPDIWQPLVVVDPDRRRYELLYKDDNVDIWVLSWMPGQRTGFHDHDLSSVALTCVQGALEEGSLGLGASPTSTRMTPGTTRRGPGGYIHSVSHRAGEPAVSIHAYSPPLTCVGQYRADGDGRLRREPEHGRRELADSSIPVGANRVDGSRRPGRPSDLASRGPVPLGQGR